MTASESYSDIKCERPVEDREKETDQQKPCGDICPLHCSGSPVHNVRNERSYEADDRNRHKHNVKRLTAKAHRRTRIDGSSPDAELTESAEEADGLPCALPSHLSGLYLMPPNWNRSARSL
jgi:hypothetical protein